MCGRFALTTPIEVLRQAFGFVGPAPNLPARWNIAPTQSTPVIRRAESGGRELAALRWGLVPSWADSPSIGAKMINARAETVAEKPAFRAAFKARRCLVPADGFYEWPTRGDLASRQPVLFRRRDGGPFAFAGLWERWVPAAGGLIESFAIVSTAANEIMAQYHERVPVVLAPGDYAAWLDPAADARALLKAPPSDWFSAARVSTYVNDVRHDDAGCFAPPVDEPPPPAKPSRKPRARPADDRQPSLF